MFESGLDEDGFRMDSKQNTQSTYNVTLWRFSVTIDAVDTQECILLVLLSYISMSTV